MNFLESLNPGRVNIVVVAAGSSPEPIYPTAAWWQLALSMLGDEFPGAHFFLTGKSRADDRSSTLAFSRTDVDRFTSASDRVFDCYDVSGVGPGEQEDYFCMNKQRIQAGDALWVSDYRYGKDLNVITMKGSSCKD